VPFAQRDYCPGLKLEMLRLLLSRSRRITSSAIVQCLLLPSLARQRSVIGRQRVALKRSLKWHTTFGENRRCIKIVPVNEGHTEELCKFNWIRSSFQAVSRSPPPSTSDITVSLVANGLVGPKKVLRHRTWTLNCDHFHSGLSSQARERSGVATHADMAKAETEIRDDGRQKVTFG